LIFVFVIKRNIKIIDIKKIVLAASYFSVLAVVFSLNSCQDDPITPNGSGGSTADKTWIDDSTSWNGGGGNPCDSTNGGDNTNPNDTTVWNPNYSTSWDPNGGGNTNPNDTTSWNPADSIGEE